MRVPLKDAPSLGGVWSDPKTDKQRADRRDLPRTSEAVRFREGGAILTPKLLKTPQVVASEVPSQRRGKFQFKIQKGKSMRVKCLHLCPAATSAPSGDSVPHIILCREKASGLFL